MSLGNDESVMQIWVQTTDCALVVSVLRHVSMSLIPVKQNHPRYASRPVDGEGVERCWVQTKGSETRGM